VLALWTIFLMFCWLSFWMPVCGRLAVDRDLRFGVGLALGFVGPVGAFVIMAWPRVSGWISRASS